MSEYKPDPDYAETKVKNPGTSKGRKGNVMPKTVSVPNLINEGTYVDTKPRKTHGGGKGAQFKSSGVNAPKNPIEAIYNTAPKKPGKMTISELSGQYTGVPKSGGR